MVPVKEFLAKVYKIIRLYPGIASGLLSLIIFLVFRLYPSFAEIFYRGIFYQGIRFCWDHSASLLPFPVLYLIIPFMVVVSIIIWRRMVRRGALRLLILPDLAGRLLVLFFVSWGYNYACRPVEAPVVQRIDDSVLLEAGMRLTERMNTTSRDQQLLEVLPVTEAEIHQLHLAAAQVFGEYNIPSAGRPIPKTIPFGWLRKAGITGIYFPFSAEAHVDGSMLHVQQLFVSAHEMAHAYGIAGEGEADYIAFKMLMRAAEIDPSNAGFRYCAGMELLRSIRGRLYQSAPELKARLDSALAPVLAADLAAIRANARQYSEWIPGMQQEMNDRYLKTMGIASGTASYDEFIELVLRDSIWP